MKKYVYIVTWGCQMNEYDSERLFDLLRISKNFYPTDNPEKADLLILNTCSIREKPQEKLFHQLGRWANFKTNRKKESAPLIAVGGCVAVQEKESLLKRAPYIDIIFGPQTLHRLPDLISQREQASNRKVIIDICEISNVEEKFDQIPFQSKTAHIASISIMEGCDKFCSYCVVPYTRGPEVCRTKKSILEEVHHCLSQGAKEIILLGQNVNAWREHSQSGSSYSFADLLHQLCKIEELKRVRFVTSHPLECTADLCAVYAEERKLMSFLHLPLQSGSDRILAAMHRGHTAKDYLDIIKKLKQSRPDLLISSDFIVGFPGETQKDFEATLEMTQKVGFDISYCFLYSKRPNTPAAQLEDPIPLDEKKERLQFLQKQLAKNVIKNTRQFLKTNQEVLVEDLSEQAPFVCRGRSSNNRWVTFQSERPCLGEMVKVNIRAISGSGLIGEKI